MVRFNIRAHIARRAGSLVLAAVPALSLPGAAHNRRRWCIAALMALLGGCAHDPAPKAGCHGPWIWITPGLAGGSVKKQNAAPKGAEGRRGPSELQPETPPAGGHP
jgi:hypothetical protein